VITARPGNAPRLGESLKLCDCETFSVGSLLRFNQPGICYGDEIKLLLHQKGSSGSSKGEVLEKNDSLEATETASSTGSSQSGYNSLPI
jgi:hypothetical protein